MFSAQVRICLQQLQRTVPRHSIWQGKTRKQPDICLNTNIYWKGISVTIQNKFRNVYFQLDKDTFVKDCKNVGDTNSESYKKIYWFSWKCFQVGKEKKFSLIKNFFPWQAADADRDGQVSGEEFGTMINVATAAQKRWVHSGARLAGHFIWLILTSGWDCQLPIRLLRNKVEIGFRI